MESLQLVQDNYYKDKTVLVTGHTGFKGSWLCVMLQLAGAKVVGYSLPAAGEENLFSLCHVADGMCSIEGDIRDLAHLKQVFEEYHPEIVFHLAAQPIVRESYQNPVYTYETNVMGTVNLMECVRTTGGVHSVLNVTTDKVYKDVRNKPYSENDELGGFDPYSNSKACSELVTRCYFDSFLNKENKTVITVRAGNVIGGGDFSANRIVPDCIKSIVALKPIKVRNPNSIRPYQHVFDALNAYLYIIEKLYDSKKFHSFNVGPSSDSVIDTKTLVNILCDYCTPNCGWEDISNSSSPHETTCLLLNSDKIKTELGWHPKFDIYNSLKGTADWYMENYFRPKNIIEYSTKLVNDYLEFTGNDRYE